MSKKARTPASNPARGITATFQAFEASFGLPSSSASARKAGPKATTARASTETPSKQPGSSKRVTSNRQAALGEPNIDKGKKRAASPDAQTGQTPRPLKRPLQSSFVDPPVSIASKGNSKAVQSISSREKGKGRAEEPSRNADEGGIGEDADVYDGEEPDIKPEIVHSVSGPAVTSLSRLQHSFRLPAPRKFPITAGSADQAIDRASKPLNALTSARAAVKVEEGTLDADRPMPAAESKPTWAVLQSKQKAEQEQDVLELLSPRKKRRGWVPAGLAERAAQVIKRAQTTHTLWAHELSRLLTINPGGSNTRDPARLAQDANPLLRLTVLQVHSGKPASLALAGTEGGFITGGSAEKLLVCTCRILSDETEQASQSETIDFGSAAGSEAQVHKEGLVLFSLACHPKSASATPLARPGQKAKAAEGKEEAIAQETGRLNFARANRTLAVPGNVADLHSLVGEGEEIWAWDPWSIIELPRQEDEASKALLVSRFAVLQSFAFAIANQSSNRPN